MEYFRHYQVWIAALILFLVFCKGFLEPLYIMIFKKLPFNHLYLFPKKLNEQEQKILDKNYKFYRNLKPKYRRSFNHKIKFFLKRYEIIGKEDLEITDEIKLLIAGSFVQLTFGLNVKSIGNFKRIILYPQEYFSKLNKTYHKGEYNPTFKTVVFSWKDFVLGNEIKNDNINLGIHEFSHVILFQKRKIQQDSNFFFFILKYEQIVKMLQNEDYLKKIKSSGFLRDYAFKNKMEFIAILLEHFYENPNELKIRFPEIYTKVKAMIGYQNAWFKS